MNAAYGVAPKRPWSSSVRFWMNIEVGATDECWPWTGDVFNHGYGRVQVLGSDGSRRAFGAHVVAWRIEHQQPVPDGKIIHHRCQTKLCVNPSHLRAVTRGEHNHIHDNLFKPGHGGGRKPQERCKRGHDDWSTSGTKYCRTCKREGQKARRARP
jgi:hypothetical protein